MTIVDTKQSSPGVSSGGTAVLATVGTGVVLAVIGATISRVAASNRRDKNKASGADGGCDTCGNKPSDESYAPPRAATVAFLDAYAAGLRGGRVISLLSSNLDDLSDDSLIKIVRQLEFWHLRGSLDDDEFVALAERRIRAATWSSRISSDSTSASSSSSSSFLVPRVRFGRTEIMMPVVTCGGMRMQDTWMPDFVPILRPLRSRVLRSTCQDNVLEIVRACLRVGINHFETARFYGTSEYQLVDALAHLVDVGEVRREDFIFQTKVPAFSSGTTFRKFFDQSWANIGSKLGYIDLFAFHCVSGRHNVDHLLDDAEDGSMAVALRLREEGKIRHMGFSTHGTAEDIMRLIDSDRFDFVNLHCHYFGSYHAEGTPDTLGGHGNVASVRRALELDMGVFLISPFDKGGMLYKPPASVASDVGPELTPMGFAALHAWKTNGIHTVSVGIGRVSDLDEVLEAAELLGGGGGRGDTGAAASVGDDLLAGAERRLRARAVDALGSDWVERGMLNLPACYDESSDGVAIGHVLWLHNLVSSYGMVDFCRARYGNLMRCPWNDRKTFEENAKKMNPGNPGRGYVANVNLDAALSGHYNPNLVKEKMAECHEWLSADLNLTDEERSDRGWDAAYDLTTWEVYPGSEPSLRGLLLQSLTWGKLGCGGGPTRMASDEGVSIRRWVRAKGDLSITSLMK